MAASSHSVIFNLFPLEGQHCPENIARSPDRDPLFDVLRDSPGGLAVILTQSSALSGRVRDLLFQFCSTSAVARRQRVIFVTPRRIVAPPPVAVHRMPNLLEDEGTPAPRRLKFVYPRSFFELMTYLSALSGLGEAALPDTVVVDGLEAFVGIASSGDALDRDGGGGEFNVDMAACEEMRLAQALSLLQEFSAGWSRAAEGGGEDGSGGGKRRAVRVVAGYSADWRGDPLALERKMAAFCVEVWTLECLGKRKGFEESVSETLRLSSRVNKSLLALEFKLGSAGGKPVLFPLSLFLEEMRVAVMI